MRGRVLVIFVLVLIALVHISNSEEDKVDENVIDFLENNEDPGVLDAGVFGSQMSSSC